MDFVKGKLSAIGGFMALAGVISAGLSLFDYNLRILMWIDMWGETIGWAIRGGLVVAGAVLFFVFKTSEDADDD